MLQFNVHSNNDKKMSFRTASHIVIFQSQYERAPPAAPVHHSFLLPHQEGPGGQGEDERGEEGGKEGTGCRSLLQRGMVLL